MNAHLDGYLYPMRMTDLSLLSYNDEPGPLTEDAAAGNEIDPLFQRLVDDWPARPRWLGEQLVMRVSGCLSSNILKELLGDTLGLPS